MSREQRILTRLSRGCRYTYREVAHLVGSEPHVISSLCNKMRSKGLLKDAGVKTCVETGKTVMAVALNN